MARYRRGHILATILVLVALALWFTPPMVVRYFTTPLQHPFPLVVGQQVSTSFVPKLSERHLVQVSLDRNLSVHRMAEIIGSIGDRRSRPRIDFRLESQGQPISVQGSKGLFVGETDGFDLGSFDGVRGQRYALTAAVTEAEPDLKAVNGHLLVRIPFLAAERFRSRVLIARLFAIITLVVALLVLAIQTAYSRGLRRGKEGILGKRSYIIAALLFAAGLAFWFVPPLIADRFTTPLHHGFGLVPGQHASLSFVPKLSERHYVSIELERNLPFPRLQEIVGGPQIEEEPPPSRPKLNFRVESHGQPVAIQPEQSQHWGKLVGFTLGSFLAKRGEAYTLTADVTSAEPDLRTLNGKLFVSVHPMTGETYYFRVLAARLLAIILAIVAVFIVSIRTAFSTRSPPG
jgi:hypothetical protein